MRKTLLLIALLISGLHAFAQSIEVDEFAELTSMTKLELGLQGIGLGYELPFNNKWSANLSAGLGGGYYIYSDGFHSSWIINEPVAYFRSEFKYTYNRVKRLSKSKSVINNAGNYVAFQATYTTRRVFNSNEWNNFADPLNRTLLNEIHWGMQRPLGQKFLFNFHLGLGYAADFDFDYGQVYPAIGAQFGYVLSKGRRL
ncbi:hypothetical protein ACFSKU_06385 [Pontibacter silvestris]|uniref:DUF3575 domain-containing protein n=1 Tax=Pontibacter silvestris TaxID=2305183 RepID=A0ABW4WWD1_9BACT|nr:hypothetical protein [Pontibacter silvestris]MCC9136462.1 hypothetical protein [Pontibacter silvestris]